MHFLDLMALLGGALIAAKVLSGLASRLRIPSVIVELLMGVGLAYFFEDFGTLREMPMVQGLSELGVLFLLFAVGLETNLLEMTKVGKEATFAAIFGVLAPFGLAFLSLPLLFGMGFQHALFMAAALTATSVGITARVLLDLGSLTSVSGRIILGAAVIDDVLGIIVLAIVSALVTQGSVSAGYMAFLLLKIGLFVLGVAALRRVLPRGLKMLQPLETSGTVTVLLLSLCLITAWTAEKIGLAGIVGAFALGIALEDIHFEGFRETGSVKLFEMLKPLTDFLAPIFFIVMGMGVDLKALKTPGALTLMGVLIVCAILGKLACALAVRKDARAHGADPWLVGLGMMPRGEVGLIFAVMGSRLGVLNEADYAAVVGMVVVTTLLAPFLLGWRSRKINHAPVDIIHV